MRGWNPVGDKCLTAAKRDCFAFNCTQRPMKVDACSRARVLPKFVERLHASLAANAYNARGQVVVGRAAVSLRVFARRGRGRGGLAPMSDSLFRGRILSPPQTKA